MYQIRGNRVSPLTEGEITKKALTACLVLGFSSPYKYKRKPKRFDQALEQLSEYQITIDPINDEEWREKTFDLTIGHCQPEILTISIPERIYYLACKGERDALMVIFHELGHLLLQHKALLHFSSVNAEQNEDAEWQADLFAETMLQKLGYDTAQLSFDFY
ncbi:ImmA/IrrE family metallo-endopeptidase [Erwinia rhapontici]|uniref:ImmA/IrrE family metallo-endopeptidase n=1 Tax=Erwinia rhapontici TaxID=55212 RepID=UPI003D3617F6